MRILIIGKYPPIEGGVSSRTYWLAHALAKRGVEVTVLTNAFRVEESYREKLDLSDEETQKRFEGPNINVRSLNTPPPRHIPYSEAYVSCLVSAGLEIIGEKKYDLIYTHYLEPYGTASLFLKQLTGIPYVAQHAGSDIYRLLQSPELVRLLGTVLIRADGVFLSRSLKSLSNTLGLKTSKVHHIPRVGIPPEFSPEGEGFLFAKYGVSEPPKNIPLVTYIGKIGKNKSLLSLCKALQNTSSDFRLFLVTRIEPERVFAKFLLENPAFAEKVICPGFLPPWEIPRILRSSTLLAHLEHKFPIPIHSPIQPFEGIASGTPLLLSAEIHKKVGFSLPATKHLLNVVEDPDDIPALTGKIKEVLQDREKVKQNAARIREEFLSSSRWDTYVENYMNVFEKVTRKRRGFFRLAD